MYGQSHVCIIENVLKRHHIEETTSLAGLHYTKTYYFSSLKSSLLWDFVPFCIAMTLHIMPHHLLIFFSFPFFQVGWDFWDYHNSWALFFSGKSNYLFIPLWLWSEYYIWPILVGKIKCTARYGWGPKIFIFP